MKNRLIITFLLLISSFHEEVFSADICQDLAKYSLQRKGEHDGTGVGTIRDSRELKKHYIRHVEGDLEALWVNNRKEALEKLNLNNFDSRNQKLLDEAKVLAKEVILENIQDKEVAEKILKIIELVKVFRMEEPFLLSEGAKLDDLFEFRTSFYRTYKSGERLVTIAPGAYLENSSLFYLMQTLAHEMGHAIGPCGIVDSPFIFSYSNTQSKDQCFAENPFVEVLECLRLDTSVGAERRGLNAFSKGKKIFCNGTDQINEAFSDWIAAEVLAKYIEKIIADLNLTQLQIRNGYANASRDSGFLLGKNTDIGKDYNGEDLLHHPKSELRVNRIILANPKIREQMGCPPLDEQLTYCGK